MTTQNRPAQPVRPAPALRRWKVGDPVSAAHLNELVDALVAPARAPQQVPGRPQGTKPGLAVIQNVGSEVIPGNSFVEIVSALDTAPTSRGPNEFIELYKVQRPTKNSRTGDVLITFNDDIAVGGFGQARFGYGRLKYSGSAPSNGDRWGTATDSFLLTEGNDGFIVTGVFADDNIAVVREVGIADVFFKQFTFTDSTDPSNSQFNAAATSVEAEEITTDGSPTDTKIAILELNAPMTTVGALHIAGLLSGAYVAAVQSTPDMAPNITLECTYSLIKTELTGALAIDQITHDDLGSLSLEAVGTCNYDATMNPVGAQKFTAADMSVQRGHDVRPGSALTAGPYFGLHISVTGIVSFSNSNDVLTTIVNISDVKPGTATPLLRSMAKPAAFFGL